MNRLSDLKRMILLLLAGILSACSHDDLTETRPAENSEPLVLTAVMADATTGTRATPDNSWEGTETVIVEVIDNYDNMTTPDWTQAKKGIYTAGTDGKLTFTSGTQSTWLSDNETKLVRAWHYGDNSEEHPDSWSVQRNQGTDDNYANSDLLFAQATTVSGRQEIALKFYHQVAKVVVHVRNVGPVYGSDDVSVTIGYMYNIVMNGTVSTDNISENYLNWTPGSTMETITAYSLGPKPLASDENETSLASFAALVIPQTVKSMFSYLDIKNGLSSYPCYSSTEITWEAGHSYTYEVTIMKENRVTVDNITVSGWDNGGNYDLTTTE